MGSWHRLRILCFLLADDALLPADMASTSLCFPACGPHAVPDDLREHVSVRASALVVVQDPLCKPVLGNDVCSTIQAQKQLEHLSQALSHDSASAQKFHAKSQSS